MANGFTHFIYNILQDSYIILRHSIFLMNPIWDERFRLE